MSAYRPVDYKWTSREGEEWSVERLVAMDAGFGVKEDASCGGTHRLSALTLAVTRFMQETNTPPNKLTGGWKKAEDLIQDSLKKARAYQQPDGSFSANLFVRPCSSPEVDTTLHSTGHTLEWLAVALTDQQLREPWVTAAVNRLCQLLEDNANRPLDCGALYHAARGLKLYRERRFGPRDGSSPTIAKASGPSAGRDQDVSASKPSAESADDAAPPPPAAIGQSR